jgi:PPP family 3-phenylpropionic acid transporter
MRAFTFSSAAALPANPGADALGVRVALFFAALFLAYGIVVPYFPVWLNARGLDAMQIATVTAVPLFVRLLVTPGVGMLADRIGDHRRVLLAISWTALALIAGLGLVDGYVPILVIGVAFLLCNSTMLPLIETVAVAGVRNAGLDYGRMRLWGSITFILANFAGGIAIEALGGSFALWLIALGGILTIAAARALPAPAAAPRSPPRLADWRTSSPARLLASRQFLLFLIAIGCTHGAHATFYTFGALHWQAQGLSAAWIGTLWAIGVIAEVLLFAWSAPVTRRFGPAQLIAVGAGASVLRWGIMAFDPPLAVLIPLQAVHALTYGAAHLGAILFITRAVPQQGMGSAQAFYATIASGLALGIVGLLSGALYEVVGGKVFLVPAGAALIGCVAGVLLLRGWDGRWLWADDSEPRGLPSPTAPAAAG